MGRLKWKSLIDGIILCWCYSKLSLEGREFRSHLCDHVSLHVQIAKAFAQSVRSGPMPSGVQTQVQSHIFKRLP